MPSALTTADLTSGRGPLTREGVVLPGVLAQETFAYIGSPEGLGRALKIPPFLDEPIKRNVLTASGTFEEREIILHQAIGSGLGGIVFRGTCQGKEIVEKFSADLPFDRTKGFAKKFMELQFMLYRQSLPSYRVNFYAAMANHYASLIIYDAGEFEFGKPFIPRLEYTCYDRDSGGYCSAYAFIRGRPVRPGPEEKILKERLAGWKQFIAGQLGLWGLARQCDVRNINSAGNVFVVDETTGEMKLIDVTPGVIGGQVYFLPLEMEYFFKGLFTGNFLPFGDAVDLKKLHQYRRKAVEDLFKRGDPYVQQRVDAFNRNCGMFEFYVKAWRRSEPALVRSPARAVQYFLNMETVKATTLSMITNLEYQGVMDAPECALLREQALGAVRRRELLRLRGGLVLKLSGLLIRKIPRAIWSVAQWVVRDVFLGGVQMISRGLIFIFKVYVSKAYRSRVTREKIRKWIDAAQKIDHSIDEKEAAVLKRSLADKDILEIVELGTLWAIVKIIKPPFVGTMANLTLAYLFFTTFNPYVLAALFADGVIRFIIAVAFTGFRYKLLLALSLIPTIGFIVPIPAQLMVSAPRLTDFLMRHVLGTKLGTSVPGVDRHSFRTYFYIRAMGIPLFLMKLLAWPFQKAGRFFDSGVPAA